MSNVELGLLAFVVMAWALAGGVHLLTRQFGRDRIFKGVTPGQVPGELGSVGAASRPSAQLQRHGASALQTERVRGGREYRGEVAVQFQPPRGLTPGLVGTVVDGRAEMRDVTATILDLAVRGYLTITPLDPQVQEAAGTRPGPQVPWTPVPQARAPRTTPGRKDWLITRADTDPRPGQELLPFEGRLLRGLFAQGPQVRMSQLNSRFANLMHEVQDDLYQQVQRRGWYERHPQATGGCVSALAVVVGILAGVIFFAAAPGIWGGIAGVLLAGAGFSIGNSLKWRTPRTALGTAVQIQTLGFKKYLATAEAEQIRFEEAADIFSRYLPYAIVFGVADHWAKVFGDVASRARAEGIDMPLQLDWFDGYLLASVIDDLLWVGADGLDMLDLMGGGMDLMQLGGDVAGGVADVAGNLGDFLDGLDLDFFDF